MADDLNMLLGGLGLSANNLVGGSTAGNTYGIKALMERPKYGLDFLSFARGQQMANDISWQNRQRDLGAQALADWERNRKINREVQTYLSPLAGNMAAAESNGIPKHQFILDQMNAISGDEGFRSLTPEAQNKIREYMANQGKTLINDYLSTGDPAQAQAAYTLAQGLGIPTVTNWDVARASGNLDSMVNALGIGLEKGTTIDGTPGYRIPGTSRVISGDDVYSLLSRAKTLGEARNLLGGAASALQGNEYNYWQAGRTADDVQRRSRADAQFNNNLARSNMQYSLALQQQYAQQAQQQQAAQALGSLAASKEGQELIRNISNYVDSMRGKIANPEGLSEEQIIASLARQYLALNKPQ